MKDSKKFLIILLAGMVGFVLIIQIKSFRGINGLLRDQQSNVFQEIRILKEKNEALKVEVASLEDAVLKLNDQGLALSAVEEEMKKYRKLSGNEGVYGTGLSINLGGEISTFWMTDLVNEIFGSGAQAVAINSIRLTNRSVGFDTLPHGQILLNGSILSAPYQIDIIGESKVLANILMLKGGILDRLKAQFPNLTIDLTTKEIVQMI